jgi:hypothetical protein
MAEGRAGPRRVAPRWDLFFPFSGSRGQPAVTASSVTSQCRDSYSVAQFAGIFCSLVCRFVQLLIPLPDRERPSELRPSTSGLRLLLRFADYSDRWRSFSTVPRRNYGYGASQYYAKFDKCDSCSLRGEVFRAKEARLPSSMRLPGQ